MPGRDARLFTEPFISFSNQKMQDADAAFDRLADQDLLSADVHLHLQKIASFNFLVAQLQPQDKRAKRRTERRPTVGFDEDDPCLDVDILDVSIPYAGFPRSFSLAPSSCHVLHERASAHGEMGKSLVVSLDEDKNVETRLATFIQRVEENLERLRQDLDALKADIFARLEIKAEARINAIKERQQKNRSYSFPVE